MTISIIVATNRRGCIGNDGHLVWNIPEDLAYFKELTSGHDIVMGRKTWESLPIRPLQNRTNYILTRNIDYNSPGAIVCHSMNDVPTNNLFVIGGEEIYRLYLHKTDVVYITIVDNWSYGDRFFPFEKDFFIVSESEKKRSVSGLEYRFLVMK